MKFRGHETFFIRKGWLNKGIKNVKKMPGLFSDRSVNPMDVLGIGSVMVKSLRYWLQATGLTEEVRSKQRTQQFTVFGNIIAREDPYIEELGTLWLLHYKLSTSKEMATSWYYFFNIFPLREFTKDDFIAGVTNFVRAHGEEVSNRSLEDDFNCIINTYIPRYKLNPQKAKPEDNMDCPLGELGLLDIQNVKNRIYRRMIPRKDSIDPAVLVASILESAGERTEVSLQRILSGEGFPGKLFNLDTITLMGILSLAEARGYVRIIRTAGLDVVQISKELTAQKCVENYYRNLR